MITKLTLEQENKISLYRERWLSKIFNYELYNSKSEESIIKSGKELYKFSNLKEPVVLVVGSPLACQLVANLIQSDQIRDQIMDQVWDKFNRIRIQTETQLEDQVGIQVGSQGWVPVWSQTGDQFGNQVRDQIRTQIGDRIKNHIEDQIGDQIENQIEIQTVNQIWGQIWDQVIIQVGDQIGEQVRGQIRTPAWDQVRTQIGSKIWNQIIKQFWDQIATRNENQIDSRVIAQIGNQVESQIGNQFNQVGNQVRNQVRNQVENQIEPKIENQKFTYFDFSSYINYSDFGWCSFYNYFNTEFNIIEKELSDTFNKIIDFVDHSFMSIQLKDLLIVSKYPNFISRNSNNDLHNTKRAAISFEDGYEQFYVNGRNISKEIFEKSQQLTSAKEIFQNEKNEDIKAVIITIIKENFGNEGLLEMLDAIVIDEQTINHPNNYTEKIRILHSKQKYSFLQNSKGELNQPYAWIEMTCPSTGSVYLIDTCPTFINALECAKWHRPNEIPTELEYSWISAN